MFKKRGYFYLTLLFFIFVILSACSSGGGNESKAKDASSKTLNYSHFWPSHHLVHTNVLEVLQDNLKEDEGIDMEIYPSGQLGTPDAQYDMAVTGTADMSLSVHGYTPGKFPLMSVSDLPFLANSSEEASEIIWELYKDSPDLQNEHSEVTTLWIFAGEPNQLLSTGKPIERLEDLKGLKVRSPSPISTELIKAWGGVPVSMPVNDIYESLDKGIIDAAMAGMSTLFDLNLHEVVDYVTIGNFSTSSLFSVMNTDTFNGLPENSQEYLLSIGDEMSSLAGAALDEAGEEGYNQAEESGIEIIELDDAEIVKWQEAATPVIEEWIADMDKQGLPGEEIYENLQQIK